NGIKNGKFVLCHSTMMIRTSLIRKIGGYMIDDHPTPDLGLVWRLSREGKLANLDRSYSLIRLHTNSFTHNYLKAIVKKIKKGRYKSNSLNIFWKFRYNLDYVSIMLYRKGILLYLNQRTFSGGFLMFLAGLFNPCRVIYFLRFKWY
ncbi:MAG: hypothetical protein ACW98D_21340, partial [Promethearchaeota archaeon]